MAEGRLEPLIHHLLHAAACRDGGRMTDGQLLERFVRQHDAAAFESLLWRHSRMVQGVCRRVLHDSHEVEDVFQATFLVLVRKAHSISRRESVASWLYKVAFRIALKAKAQADSRPSHDRQVNDIAAPEPPFDCSWRDLRPAL